MNKRLKKFLALLLCVGMVFCNTLPYFALDNLDEIIVSESVKDISDVSIDKSLLANDLVGDVSTNLSMESSKTLNVEEENSSDSEDMTTLDLENEIEEEEDELESLYDESDENEAIEQSESKSDEGTKSESDEETDRENINDEETDSENTNDKEAENESENKNDDNSIESDNKIFINEDINLNENIATSSIVELADDENDEKDFEVEEIATKSEIEENIVLDYAEKNIASKSEIEVATSSDAINDDETMPTGFLKLDYEAPKAKTLFRNRLFGVESSYDSRTKTNPENPSMSIVPPIRNQGSYETCWAFSTIGMMEINARKKGLVTNEAESNLSEAAVAYFTYDGMKQALDSTQSDYSESIDKPGVEGYDKTYLSSSSPHFANRQGRQDIAALAMTSYLGAVVEDENTKYDNLPTIISNFQGSGLGLPGKYAFNSNSLVIKDVKFINKDNRDLIKQAVKDYGSVGFAYKAHGSNYKKVGDDFYVYQTSGTSNHAITIVGWNDNVPTSNFNTEPPSSGAWLCRNSYGESHANGGYFWLSYYDETIDGTMYAIETMKADTYEYNYHYDTAGDLNLYGKNYDVSESEPFRFANIFKVSDDYHQVLTDVNVAVYSTNSKFNIKIYTKDTEMYYPADGTLASTTTGITKDTAGAYTIKLTTPVVLKKDTYYSIIIEGTAGTVSSTANRFALYASIPEDNIETIQFRNAASLKQSYYGFGEISNRNRWADINDSSVSDYYKVVDGVQCGLNLRIKGLANRAPLITFDSNGGTGTMSDQPVIKNVSIPINANEFTRTGYTFDGWRDEATGNTYSDGANITVTEDTTTLKAKWNPIYTVTYNPGLGTVSPSTFEKTYGTNVDVSTLAVPTRNGYDFDKWYKDSGLTEEYTGDDSIYSATGTIYIYAKYDPHTYNIALKALGGEDPSSTGDTNTTYTSGTAKTLPMDYKKEDKPIIGWWTEYDASSGTYSGEKVTIIPETPPEYIYNATSNPINLYARYGTPHTITFSPGEGGEGAMGPQTIYEEVETIINGVAFWRSGYSFAGWRASNGATYGNGANIGYINTNLTLTALWSKDPSGGGGSRPGGGGGGGGGGGAGIPATNQSVTNTTLSVDMSQVAISFTSAATSAWQADPTTGKWHLTTVNAFGQMEEVKNAWACIDTPALINGQTISVQEFYYFDEKGEMLTGWLSDASGKKYYLEPAATSEMGKMSRGWKAIGTDYYYFNSDGTLMISGTTPDGYTVDASGKWLK